MTIMTSTRIKVRSLTVISLLMVLLISTGCHTHKKNTHLTERSFEQIHFHNIDGVQSDLVREAYEWMGTPYAYAHSEKGEGTDCSGMVLKVYENVTGVKLPRNSAKQAEFCRQIDEREVECGDLVFFATGHEPDKISHVGMMVEEGKFIHASSKKGVLISDLNTPYYMRTFIMFGRVPR